VHSSAPAEWKQKQEDKKRKYGGKDDGEKRGNAQPTKYQRAGEKKHCWNFDFGKGSCRNGAKCNFLHEKGEGQGKGKGKGKGGKGKYDKKQRNQVATMVASELKKQTTKLAKKIKEKKNKKSGRNKKDESSSESDEDSFANMMLKMWLCPVSNTIPRNPIKSKTLILTSNLHDVNANCGIDTDAGMSISTLRTDFPLGINESEELVSQLPTPSGINGGESKVAGMGPMIVRAKTGELIVDPDGLYLLPGKHQPNFRVMAGQRLKANGLRLVQCFNDTNIDVLQDRRTKHIVSLEEDGPEGKTILVLATMPCPNFKNRIMMKGMIEDIRRKNISAMIVKMDYSKQHRSSILFV
jgi:hypothetical protein